MSEPNFNIDPLFDTPSEEWGICRYCNDDFLVEEHEQGLCVPCHDKELENE